jgi:hypothetical protein
MSGEMSMIKLGHSPAHRVACILALVALVAGSALPASAQRRRTRAAATLYTVQRDTTIRVRINEKISSGDARVGDRFTTTVVDPVYVRGVEVIPDGSTITGRVTSVKRAGRKDEEGPSAVSRLIGMIPTKVKLAAAGGAVKAGGKEAVHELGQRARRKHGKRARH